MTDPNLQFPAVFCENLRCSAVSCALWMLEFLGRRGVKLRKDLRFCAKLCVLGLVCHLWSVPLSMPWFKGATLEFTRESAHLGNSQPPPPEDCQKSELFRALHLRLVFRCENTQPFLCNELGHFQEVLVQAICLGPFQETQAISGKPRRF